MFMEQFSLDGMVGVVTGAGRGLGRVYYHAFAEAGADLVVAEINPETGTETAEQIRSTDRRSVFIETDVRQRHSVELMVEETLREFGRIDFLVNNAGLARVCPSVDIPEEDWRDTFDVNLNGMFFCCQAVGRHMIRRRAGSTVNISSIADRIANRGRLHLSYNVSKAGVTQLTSVLACEWAQYNVRINGIAPGFVATEHVKPALEDPNYGGQVIPWIPMQRPAVPEELAPLAIFLVSSASSYMTGSTVVIDGGYTRW